MDEIMTTQQLSDSLKLLAACFYEPETELFEEENVCRNLASLFEHLCPEARASALDMSQALQKGGPEELQVAHAELFLGPFELKASPYGSTYLEKEGRIMGDSTMEVLNHYRREGLEVDVKEPPDHIAIELEFLSFLCALEAEALQGGEIIKAEGLQAEQKLFLERYVLPWMPDFVENIRSGTENVFYLCLADCFEKFLQRFALLKGTSGLSNKDSMKAYANSATH